MASVKDSKSFWGIEMGQFRAAQPKKQCTESRSGSIKMSYAIGLWFFLGLTSCKQGEQNETTILSPLELSAVNVVDYGENYVTLELNGLVTSSQIKENDLMDFYTSSSCSGSPLATRGRLSFQQEGLRLNLAGNQLTSIFLATRSSTDCILIETYQPRELKPTPPVLQRTAPQSPSRESYRPGVFGLAYPLSGQVEFFRDEGCSLSAGTGPITSLVSSGILLELLEGTTTSVYGRSRDSLGQISACKKLFDYRHTTDVIEGPVFAQITPPSPNNSVLNPVVRATTTNTVTSVSLYLDAACSVVVAADADPTQLSSEGLEISVLENADNLIYAKALNSEGVPSNCVYLTTYVHNNQPPDAPEFVEALPVSPTRLTTFPAVKGTVDTRAQSVDFFNEALCSTLIGSGTRSQFIGVGITANVAANDTTQIFAQSVDSAQNRSSCVLLTNYRHNTIAPLNPTFGGTTPLAPTNGTLTPLVFGEPSERTENIYLFSDETCSTAIGSGSATDFETIGLTISATANSNNDFYVRVNDLEGNLSACGFLGSYPHSNLPAPNPGFFTTFPTSPTRVSNSPFVVGTAAASVTTVRLFDESSCANQVGSGTRGQFVASGIQITVPINSTRQLHAISTDIFGNDSACTFLATFIHNIIAPIDPTFTEVIPLSPNNVSFTPTLRGTSLQEMASQLPPLRIDFFDSSLCINKIGEGLPSDFSAAGISIGVAQNAETLIFARAVDAAGNRSACTFMTSYIYNNLRPANPIFLAANPASPSYSQTIRIRGAYGASTDFMNRVSVRFFTDAGCATEFASGSPVDFQVDGVEVVMPPNQVTSVYAQSVNEVGTSSTCQFLTNFRHYDLPLNNLSVSINPNGSVGMNWLPDLVSIPTPSYSIERGLSPTGPFVVIATGQLSNTFTDNTVSNDKTYYYRVYASNSTGRSQYTSVVSATISTSTPVQPLNLTALPGSNRITLNWTGFNQNTSYKIYRSVIEGDVFGELIAVTSSLSFIDTTVTNGNLYYYYVSGINPFGESLRSNVVASTPRTTPTAPSHLQLTPRLSLDSCAGGPGIELSWTPSRYFDEFNVLRGANAPPSNFWRIRPVSHTTACEGDLLDVGQRTAFAIRSRWGQTTSSVSNTRGFFRTASPVFNVYPGNNEVALSWEQPDVGNFFTLVNPARYDLFRSSSAEGPFSLLVEGTSDLSYVDTTASNGASYFYYLQAYNLLNTEKQFAGWPSPQVGAAPGPAPSIGPTDLILSRDPATGQLSLNFKAPNYYGGFRLYWSDQPTGPFSLQRTFEEKVVFNPLVFSGMNYFQIRGIWGSTETAPSNTVSIRVAEVVGLTATELTTGIRLDWLAVDSASHYRLERAESLIGPFSPLTIIAEPETTYLDETLVSNTGYYYRLTALFADATEGQPSLPVGANFDTDSAPKAVSLAVTGPTELTLDWLPVAGANEYQILLAEDSLGPFTQVASTPANPFLIGALEVDTEYFVRVRAIVSSTPFTSETVSAFTLGASTPPSGIPGDGLIDLSWSSVPGALSYNVQRSLDLVNFTTLATNLPATTYLDSAVVNGSVYYYRILTNFNLGTALSGSSTSLVPGLTPRVPTGLSLVRNQSGSDVSVSWVRQPEATRYLIYLSTTSGSYGAPFLTTTASSDVFIGGLTSGTTYFMTVAAQTGSTTSSRSSEIAFVPSLTPGAPQAQRETASSVLVSWSAQPGATTYDVERTQDRGASFVRVASGIASLSYEDTPSDLSITYAYRYRPRAASGALFGFSDLSQNVSLSVEPLTPTGIELRARNTGEVDVRWAPTPNVASHEIMRGTSTGGPYSSVGLVMTGTNNFIDSTVVAGTTYYYVVIARSDSGVPSAPSVEKSIRLVAGPTNLVASSSASGVQLTWDSVGGASGYRVLRSRISGTQYGVLTSTTSLTYLDSSALPDESYYYVVEAVFGSAISVESNEAAIVRSGAIDIEVPIELTDLPLASSSSEAIAFERTLTSIDPARYDGTVSYFFEVIARNDDAVARDIELIDQDGSLHATISVPGLTTEETRIRTAFSAPGARSVFRLRLAQTSAEQSLFVVRSLVLIRQTGATRTRLYIPLVSASDSMSLSQPNQSLFSTSSTTLTKLPQALLWLRELSSYRRLRDFNGLEIEAVVSTTGSASGQFVLYNRDRNEEVSPTRTRFFENDLSLARTQFSHRTPTFDIANEGEHFELRLKCEYQCGSGEARMHKAGLWIDLENLTEALVFYRAASAQNNLTSAGPLPNWRTYLDLNAFSQSEVYFQAQGSVSSAGETATLQLRSHNLDQGIIGLTSVTGSNLILDSTEPMLSRTLALPSLTSPQRFVTEIQSVAGQLQLDSSFLVIKATSP